MTRKGAISIEFVVATTIFLIAFWFIYLQSTIFLSAPEIRSDVRHAPAEFYSTILLSTPGEASDWSSWPPTNFGLALYEDNATHIGILDKSKLDAVDGQACNNTLPRMFRGMEFGFEVTTKTGNWQCSTNLPKTNIVKRPIYVKKGGGSYSPGILEVWVG